MKLIALLFAAFAPIDTTIVSYLPAHSIRIETVAVNEGRTEIEVFTDGDREGLTCTFRYVGENVGRQEHTHHCHVITNDLVLPATLGIQVENNESHPIHYTVRATTVVPVK